MDIVRWVVLCLLFGGLFALWLWSRRQAKLARTPGKNAGPGFKIAQKRWLDQRTGVCLIDVEGQNYLLAYTVGGGVSWQPVAPKKAEDSLADLPPENFEAILSEAGLQ